MTEREIFTAALEIHEPHVRADWLRSTCGTNDALLQQVESLLRSHDDAGSFLEQSPLSPEATHTPSGDTARPQPVGQVTTLADASPVGDGLDFLAPTSRPGLLGTLDHYDVLAVIGRGGMGVVLKALDTRLHRVVAVKVLAPEFAANPTARKRFLREAQAAAAVSHPHVVTIFAVEDRSSTPAVPSSRSAGAQLPYLVMEYIAGQTLRDKIERVGALELPAILRIGSQIAYGLAAAHKQGLIHRDIKPANVLLENGVERVKLTDFGLARAVDDVSVTRTGEVSGTPQFMSPEQAQGEGVDHRSDLFSLGSVLYTMCTGRPPFRGDTVVSVLRRVCDEQPRPIREVNPEIPQWLAETIDRLLAKNPTQRFASATEIADLLGERLSQLRGGPVTAPTPPNPAVATAGLSGRWLTIAAAIVLVVIALGTTEATGVTNFAGTIVRIVRGDGVLVVTIDDPEVSVSIEGEDLVITGAGAKEIRVPAGQHRLTFHKDGRPIDQQLVSVSRGGREIVTATFSQRGAVTPTVSVTPESQAASTITSNDPYAVLGPSIAVGQSPCWSPDGKQIVFARRIIYEPGHVPGIDIYDVATGAVRTLVDAAGAMPGREFGDPVWSPDGTQIAFGSGPAHGESAKQEVWVISAAGGEPRKLDSGGFPQWGSQSGRLYYSSRVGEVLLMSCAPQDPDLDIQRHFRLSSLYPCISPDERWLAQGAGSALRVYDLQTRQVAKHWQLPLAVNGMLCD